MSGATLVASRSTAFPRHITRVPLRYFLPLCLAYIRRAEGDVAAAAAVGEGANERHVFTCHRNPHSSRGVAGENCAAPRALSSLGLSPTPLPFPPCRGALTPLTMQRVIRAVIGAISTSPEPTYLPSSPGFSHPQNVYRRLRLGLLFFRFPPLVPFGWTLSREDSFSPIGKDGRGGWLGRRRGSRIPLRRLPVPGCLRNAPSGSSFHGAIWSLESPSFGILVPAGFYHFVDANFQGAVTKRALLFVFFLLSLLCPLWLLRQCAKMKTL